MKETFIKERISMKLFERIYSYIKCSFSGYPKEEYIYIDKKMNNHRILYKKKFIKKELFKIIYNFHDHIMSITIFNKKKYHNKIVEILNRDEFGGDL